MNRVLNTMGTEDPDSDYQPTSKPKLRKFKAKTSARIKTGGLEQNNPPQEHLAHTAKRPKHLKRLSRSVTRDSGAAGTANTSHSDPEKRTNALAQREIERAEGTQNRADLHADYRERATVAAEQEAHRAYLATTACTTYPAVNSSRLSETEDMRRLNQVWAGQEATRARNGSEDSKVYDGVKYDRKTSGPLWGKLVNHGTITSLMGRNT